MWEVAIAVLVFEAQTEMPTSNLKTEGFAIWKGTTQVSTNLTSCKLCGFVLCFANSRHRNISS